MHSLFYAARANTRACADVLPDTRLRSCACVLFAALLLGACASAPDMAHNNAQVRELATAHARSLERDIRLAPLWEKMPPVPNEATPDMLARGDFASAADKPLLRDLSQRSLAFRESLAAVMRNNGVDARLVALWLEGADAGDALRAQLHNGAITWGAYNTRMRDIHTAQRMALAEAQEAIAAQDAAQLQRARQSTEAAYMAALTQAGSAARGTPNCETIGKAMYCQ
jgi:hypothetical protein